MAIAVATPPQVTWSSAAIETVVVDLLAELLQEEPNDLRRDLLARGQQMPVDSLDLFDVLAEFKSRTGITINKRGLGRQTMRSVRQFAEYVARGQSG